MPLRRLSCVLVSFFAVSLAGESAWGQVSNCLPDGTQSSGAKYRFCMPAADRYRGDLVVYAHGYVSEFEPLGIPEDQLTLPDGTSVPGIINALGFAFAVSGYSVNGLAIKEGLLDLKDLVTIFTQQFGAPRRVYLIGVSEGGLVTAKSIEQFPGVYSGGLAACGPIGDFPFQINYFGDWRILFDYFFPGVIPGAPISIPANVISQWETVYEPAVASAVTGSPSLTQQLMTVGKIPGTTQDEIVQSHTSLGWYNVFATNDAVAKLGGQPYDNVTRTYSGSADDAALNAGVQRFTVSPAALAEMQANYQTTGVLTNPLVTMHTTGDQLIPYRHELLYRLKTTVSGSGAQHLNLPIPSYGHCNFTTGQALAGFALLIAKVSNQDISNDVLGILKTPALKNDFRQYWLSGRSWAFGR
ncbi:MAG: hypothetical protein ACKV2U_07500 [Bryobacteraceae bacterium]